MKLGRIHWARFLVWAAIIAVCGAALAHFSGVGFWPSLAIAAVALVANGFLMTLEDDMPGGFNNPSGGDTPRYVSVVGRIVRVILVVALLAISGIFLLQASDVGWRTVRGAAFASFAVAAVLAYFAIAWKSRVALVGIVLLVGVPLLVLLSRHSV